MRSCREFPLAGGTRRSDLTTTLKPSQTEKERGKLTLVNIDLLLPPILPGLLLSALWREIRGHIHTHVLRKKNQTSALQFFLSSWCFLEIVIFTVAYLLMFVVCFDHSTCSVFMVFVCQGLNAHISVCSGLSNCAHSWTGLQPVALIAPFVSLASGVSPYPQDFQGFPSVS